MKSSSNVLDFLKANEGYAKRAYLDDFSGTQRVEYSIGYGHQIKPNEMHLMTGEISQADALGLLITDLPERESIVNKYIHVPLNQNNFDALVLLTYALGYQPFINVKTGAHTDLANAINSQRTPDEIRFLWLNFDHDKNGKNTALTLRRMREFSVYTGEKKKV